MKYLILLCSIYLLACNDPATQSAGSDPTGTGSLGNDTTTATLDTFQKSTKTPNGIYAVILPCTDCKGREHTVSFAPDLTYRMEEHKMAPKGGVLKATGLWRANQGKVFLYKNDTVVARYAWQGDTLQYLQTDGAAFAMRKVSAASDNPAWQKKGTDGVLLYGVGNEPFWNIEVDKKEAISFHMAEWPKPMRFLPASPTIFPDSIVYTAENDSASIRLVILNEFCSDGMSDYIYSDRIKVTFNGQAYSGCGIEYSPAKDSGARKSKNAKR